MDEFKRISDDDFEYLFQEKPVKIGRMDHVVKPLSIEGIGRMVKSIQGPELTKNLAEAGITRSNVSSKLTQLAGILIEHAPEALEIVFQLHRDDIRKLPLKAFLALADAATEANLESQGGLEKNLIALGGMLVPMIAGALETSFNTSSTEATGGATSEDTHSGRSESS